MHRCRTMSLQTEANRGGVLLETSIRNEIKAMIVRHGMSMNDVVALLVDEYGWSSSVSNFSAKLRNETLRYREAVELADVLGCDIIWQKRR